jgi:hypothetical protein
LRFSPGYGVHVLPGTSRDAAHPLHQVQNDAFAAQNDASIAANHGHRLTLLDPDSIEHLGVVNHLKTARSPLVEPDEDLQKAGNTTQAGDHAILPGEDSARRPQSGFDGHGRRDVVGRPFQGGFNTPALPIHWPSLVGLIVAVQALERIAGLGNQHAQLSGAAAQSFHHVRRCLGKKPVIRQLAIRIG